MQFPMKLLLMSIKTNHTYHHTYIYDIYFIYLYSYHFYSLLKVIFLFINNIIVYKFSVVVFMEVLENIFRRTNEKNKQFLIAFLSLFISSFIFYFSLSIFLLASATTIAQFKMKWQQLKRRRIQQQQWETKSVKIKKSWKKAI